MSRNSICLLLCLMFGLLGCTFDHLAISLASENEVIPAPGFVAKIDERRMYRRSTPEQVPRQEGFRNIVVYRITAECKNNHDECKTVWHLRLDGTRQEVLKFKYAEILKNSVELHEAEKLEPNSDYMVIINCQTLTALGCYGTEWMHVDSVGKVTIKTTLKPSKM